MNDSSDLLGRLGEDFVHVLGHGVAFAEVLGRALGCFGVAVQRGLILLQELLLHGDIMVSDTENDKPVFRESLLLLVLTLAHGRITVIAARALGH